MPSPTTPIECKPVPESASRGAVHLVIFGGSGDLARRRLIPAVYNLLLDGLLPDKYAVIGLGRKPMTDEEFRNLVRDGVVKYSRQALVQETWDVFQSHLFYLQGKTKMPEPIRRSAPRPKKSNGICTFPETGFLSQYPSQFLCSVCEGLAHRDWRHRPPRRHPIRASSLKSRWAAISPPHGRSTK